MRPSQRRQHRQPYPGDGMGFSEKLEGLSALGSARQRANQRRVPNVLQGGDLGVLRQRDICVGEIYKAQSPSMALILRTVPIHSVHSPRFARWGELLIPTMWAMDGAPDGIPRF